MTTTRTATLGLILATLLWGLGFAIAKDAGERVNVLLEVPITSALGPITFMAVRFFLCAVIWLAVIPKARSGWTRASVWRSVILGSVLSIGMLFQMSGLNLTSASMSAFLTSLTIIFVPLAMTFLLRRPPALKVWIAVGVALAGVALMTQNDQRSSTFGVVLGVLCAVAFAAHLILINIHVPRDTPWRLVAGQFLFVSIASVVAAIALDSSLETIGTARVLRLFTDGQTLWLLTVTVILPGLGAFGLMNYFQPHVDPTRAALIYLLEPIFATLFEIVWIRQLPSALAVLGAVLILLANAMVEFTGKRSRARPATVQAGPLPTGTAEKSESTPRSRDEAR
jgi:drug/metabolite transporter (DMT)-like permease